MKLKNSLFVLAFFFFCSINLHAQDKFGIRAGYQNSNWYDSDGYVLGDPLHNFYLGFFRDNKIVPALHVGVGLEYFQNGYKATNIDNKHVLHMLSLPVYGKAKIGPVFALAGLGINVKLSEKIILNDVSSKPTDDQKSETFDFPLFVGAGFKLLMFTVEARYHWGLVGINHGLHNRYLQIGAGISF